MTTELFSLKNKVVLVTGGYGYLGQAICGGLAECDAEVFVLGREKDKFHSAFGKTNARVSYVECDVAESASVAAAFESVFDGRKKIDVLINNAFYLTSNDPLGINDEEWSHSIEGVLNSVYRCIREIVPYMKRQGGGKIINVGSMYGITVPDFSIYEDFPEFLNLPHYGAAKAAVTHMTKYFARYLGGDNINVNTISPGPFPNENVQRNKQFIHLLEGKTALRRIGEPRDLIGAFVFLCSDSSNYVTGHNLVVDGGWTLN